MLILSDHKDYPDACDILKAFLCLRLRNRQRFGERTCLHRQIKRGERETTLVGSLETAGLCHWKPSWVHPECTRTPLAT